MCSIVQHKQVSLPRKRTLGKGVLMAVVWHRSVFVKNLHFQSLGWGVFLEQA